MFWEDKTSVNLAFTISNVEFIDSVGATMATSSIPTNLQVVASLGNHLIVDNESDKITALPNPTNGDLQIQSLEGTIEVIQVF